MPDQDRSINRRGFHRAGLLAAAASALPRGPVDAVEVSRIDGEATPTPKPFLTAASDFYDVSRGNPKPYKLSGDALIDARLTPETWRCEIAADPFVEEPHTKVAATLERPLTIDAGNALDLPTLQRLGRDHVVHYLKALQCLNIDLPLGQGLWTGVPLREVLKLCGRMNNVRRINFWGFHNNDPKQLFRSSVSYTQCMETAPGELPVFLAYRLNGQPLSLERGGPVRMVVPWSHGYKSIKWLRHISLTNDPRNNDTYASGNNDPDSYLKTAAYLDKALDGKSFQRGEPVHVLGQVISGLSGVRRVEYWVRPVKDGDPPLADDAPELSRADWRPCPLEDQPAWDAILPDGVSPRHLLGFNDSGRPASWPPRYGMCSFTATLRELAPGRYEVRARAVDLNGYAQPEPRPSAKSGRNGIQVRKFEIV